MAKTETLEQFLARGGQIQKIPTTVLENQNPLVTVHSTTSGPAVILTLGEANLFYGEGKVKKSKKKKSTKQINVDDLPEALRNKYCRS